jgi:hypothetical protein
MILESNIQNENEIEKQIQPSKRQKLSNCEPRICPPILERPIENQRQNIFTT